MHTISLRQTLLSLLLLSGYSAHAAVNDIYPGDYFPADPGITTATLYTYDRAASGPYGQGRKLFEGNLDSQILAMRLSRAYSYAGMTLSPVAVLSWGDSEISPAPLASALGHKATGLGDLRLGATLWPINDRERAEYLGITATLIVPSGEYTRSQVLNVGENRWRAVLSGGWQKDLTKQLLVELSPEVAVYGDNTDYVGGKTLAQATSYALTSYVRYRVSPAWHVHVGNQLNRGGATRINGVAQNNPAENTRWTAGVTLFLPEKQQVILRFGRETDIQNGFRTDREIALRYQISY